MRAIHLPRLGQTMEEGLLTTWMVEVGQSVSVGDELYEVETEKVTTTVESTLAGTVVRLLVVGDSMLPVGQMLAVVAEPGETPTGAEVDAFVAGTPGAGSEAPAEPQGAQGAPTLPAAQTNAAAQAQPAPSGRARAMPRTRALARSLGLDVDRIAPGASGLVSEDDVRRAAGARPDDRESAAEVLEVRRLSATHRSMADTVARSWSSVPQFTQTVDVDITDWRDRRVWTRAAADTAVTVTDLVIDSVVRAATAVPEANSTFAGDHLRLYRDVNVALAVDTPDGLVVPVLHGLRDLNAAARAEIRRNVAQRARAGRLTLDDVTGGTITVSNLGATRVQGGVPLLVEPYSAIVFVGATRREVVVRGEGFALRDVCTVAVTFDHRALDGATAARFTTALAEAMEGDSHD